MTALTFSAVVNHIVVSRQKNPRWSSSSFFGIPWVVASRISSVFSSLNITLLIHFLYEFLRQFVWQIRKQFILSLLQILHRKLFFATFLEIPLAINLEISQTMVIEIYATSPSAYSFCNIFSNFFGNSFECFSDNFFGNSAILDCNCWMT